MGAPILIQGGILLTMKEGEVPESGDLLIQGDRIAALHKGSESRPASGETTVINASGCVVMPGLINAHTHTPMTLMRGVLDGVTFSTDFQPDQRQDWRANLTPDDHYWSSRLAIAEMIHTGTTAFMDMYHDVDRAAQAVLDTGLRAAIGWEVVTYQHHVEEWNRYDEATARRRFDTAVDFATQWNGKGEGRIQTLIAPHETSTCHEPWLSRCARVAGELGLAITIHVAETEQELQWCRAKHGKTPVEVIAQAGILEHHVVGAHTLAVSDSDIALLASADYTAVACLGCYLANPDLCKSVTITPVPKLLAAGVRVAIGTDAAISNNNLNIWEEMYLNSRMHGVMAKDSTLLTGDAALRLATVGGAQALGMLDQLGTLEPGKKADVIVVDTRQPHLRPLEGNLVGNLIYAASGHEVRDMIVDGRVIMRDRKITSFDEEEVLSQADATVRRLRREAGWPESYEHTIMGDVMSWYKP